MKERGWSCRLHIVSREMLENCYLFETICRVIPISSKLKYRYDIAQRLNPNQYSLLEDIALREIIQLFQVLSRHHSGSVHHHLLRRHLRAFLLQLEWWSLQEGIVLSDELLLFLAEVILGFLSGHWS